MTNIIPQDPFETWEVRITQADAAMMQQAYWILKAYEEGLIVKEAKMTTDELAIIEQEGK